jgi:hypothetical protein
VKFEGFSFWYFEIMESSIFFSSFWRFKMGGSNVGGTFLKFGGILKKFDGVQGSSTLLLKF